MTYFLSFVVILLALCNLKGAQSYKILPEAIVPKVGHGPKIGQYGFDRAFFSVVFLFLLCFIAHLYEVNRGKDMEVLACFRPGFSLLTCQWKYWHRAKNRLRDKTRYGMYNPQNVEKSGFRQSV